MTRPQQQAHTPARLCTECRHYQPYVAEWTKLQPEKGAEHATCAALIWETNEALTLVDGRALVVEHTLCQIARKEGRDCGPEAKLFAAPDKTEAA